MIGQPFRAGVAIMIASMLLSLVGCSRFDRPWKAALARPAAGETVEGPWEGTWLSEKGHGGGRLRCILEKTGHEEYRAHFDAKFWGIMRANYVVPLRGRQAEGTVEFEGEEDLGWLAGGEYRYEGRMTPAEFSATYQSKHDRGTFQMTRPR